MKTFILVLSVAVAFCGGLPSKSKQSKLEQIYAALGPNYDIKADNGDAILTVVSRESCLLLLLFALIRMDLN